MPEFLELLPPAQALALWMQALPAGSPSIEEVGLADCAGRILARPVIAPEALPAFARATVDGYAVKAADTHGASDGLPAYLRLAGEIPMGKAAGLHLAGGEAAAIHTGGMLPEGADAVVMLEYTQPVGADEIEINRPAAVNENILLPGEDVAVGQEVLPKGKRLGAAEVGGLAALGITRAAVFRKLRVAIISSGDEIVPADVRPAPGQVRDVNSLALKTLVENCGGEGVLYGIVGDSPQLLAERLRVALRECDLAVITAGSSASARDHTAAVIDQSGAPGVLVHGVNVKPGKPTILAVCDGKPVVGLPGNPVSALVIARLFVLPLLVRLSGGAEAHSAPICRARLTQNLPSQAGREDWTPVRLIQSPDGMTVEPIFYKSNLIFSLARADGLVRTAPEATGLEAGATIEVWALER